MRLGLDSAYDGRAGGYLRAALEDPPSLQDAGLFDIAIMQVSHEGRIEGKTPWKNFRKWFYTAPGLAWKLCKDYVEFGVVSLVMHPKDRQLVFSFMADDYFRLVNCLFHFGQRYSNKTRGYTSNSKVPRAMWPDFSTGAISCTHPPLTSDRRCPWK